MAAPAGAQVFTDYTEFHRLMRINAAERIVFCYPSEAPDKEPLAYGVLRDSLGRPTQITRFMFGNPDSRSGWSTMRIHYIRFDTIRTELQRRTFYNASGMPITLGDVATEEVSSRIGGTVVMRKLLDRSGKPANNQAGVSRALFREQEPGVLLQEWYYSSGKLHFGTGSDNPLHPFAEMSPQTYYRRMTLDENGDLLREEIMDFDRRSLRFPGGEKVHVYELNDCGQPARISFLNTLNQPMEDSSGVASRTFQYDNAGRLVEWRAYGINGKPKGRREDGVAGIRYTIREFDGIVLREERFDEKGKTMQ